MFFNTQINKKVLFEYSYTKNIFNTINMRGNKNRAIVNLFYFYNYLY